MSTYDGIDSFFLKRKREGGAFVDRRTHCLNVHIVGPCMWNPINIELILLLEWSTAYVSKIGKGMLLCSSPCNITRSHCFAITKSSLWQPQSECFLSYQHPKKQCDYQGARG